MIEGFVNANLEAVVTLPVQGPEGQTREVEAVIDTGFNGYLTLPPVVAADLELRVVGDAEAVLADGSEAAFDVHGATVLWDGEARYIEAGAVGIGPLAGMRLLDGYSLYVEVEDGGRVMIEPR